MQGLMQILKPLLKTHGRTDHATTLRALAAFSVVIIHFDGFSTREVFDKGSFLHSLWNFLINLGIYGPTVFFIASGFALTASLSNGNQPFKKFICRRFFRLFPLYFIVLSFHFVFQNVFEDYRNLSTSNFILKILFLDVFIPKYFYDDPIGVLATLPIEFWWSLFIPFVFLVARRFNLIAEIILGFLVLFLNLSAGDFFVDNSYVSSYGINAFWRFGLCFYLGYLSYKIRKAFPRFINSKAFMLLVLPLMVFIEIFTFDLILNIYIASVLYLVMFDFAAIALKSPFFSQTLLVSGNICYSIYLLHSPIRYTMASITSDLILVNLVSIFLLLVLCPLSYLYIEKSGIQLGETLWKRFSRSG